MNGSAVKHHGLILRQDRAMGYRMYFVGGLGGRESRISHIYAHGTIYIIYIYLGTGSSGISGKHFPPWVVAGPWDPPARPWDPCPLQKSDF